MNSFWRFLNYQNQFLVEPPKSFYSTLRRTTQTYKTVGPGPLLAASPEMLPASCACPHWSRLTPLGRMPGGWPPGGRGGLGLRGSTLRAWSKGRIVQPSCRLLPFRPHNTGISSACFGLQPARARRRGKIDSKSMRTVTSPFGLIFLLARLALCEKLAVMAGSRLCRALRPCVRPHSMHVHAQEAPVRFNSKTPLPISIVASAHAHFATRTLAIVDN